MSGRTIDVGGVHLNENENDEGAFVTADPDAYISADQLWELGVGILSWFGATALTTDLEAVKDLLEQVMIDNGERCLDDNTDRAVVVRELFAALMRKSPP
jgi:hypothetical protein